MRRRIAALALMAALLLGLAPARAEASGVLMGGGERTLYKLMLTDGNIDEALADAAVFGNEEFARRDVRSITFLDSLEDAPSDAWDVSAAGDASVLAWIANGEPEYHLTIDGEGSLIAPDSGMGPAAELYIAAEGGVVANPDSAWLFSGYRSVESIDFNGCFSTAGVEDMTAMFQNCESLTGLDLSGFDTGAARDMFQMFAGCSRLASLDLSGFDASLVEDMRGMFYDCDSLRELNLSGLNTGSAVYMSEMFYGCHSLEGLDLSSFDTARVEYMENMFGDCGALARLDLYSFDTRRVRDMSGMFKFCESIQDVIVSEDFVMNGRAESMLDYTPLKRDA